MFHKTIKLMINAGTKRTQIILMTFQFINNTTIFDNLLRFMKLLMRTYDLIEFEGCFRLRVHEARSKVLAVPGTF